MYEWQYHLFCDCIKNGKRFIQVHSVGSFKLKEQNIPDFGKCDKCEKPFKINKKVPYYIDEELKKIKKEKEVIVNVIT